MLNAKLEIAYTSSDENVFIYYMPRNDACKMYV